jgi:hypothetical protein
MKTKSHSVCKPPNQLFLAYKNVDLDPIPLFYLQIQARLPLLQQIVVKFHPIALYQVTAAVIHLVLQLQLTIMVLKLRVMIKLQVKDKNKPAPLMLHRKGD